MVAGRVALALRKRTGSSGCGLLALTSVKQGKHLATVGMQTETRTGHTLMTDGVLPLTDPACAKAIAASWIVANSPEKCLESLKL